MTTGANTKGRIKGAALRLFVAKGVAETSVREIAKAAGVAQGSLYNYFPSKDDLAWELFSENYSAIGHELRRLQRAHDTLRAKLGAMIRYIYNLFDEDWVLASFVFFARHEQLRRVTAELGNPYLVFHNVIADAMMREEIPHSDPDVAASMVCGAILQVGDMKVLRRIKRNLADISDIVADGCLAMLMSVEGAAGKPGELPEAGGRRLHEVG